jgi:Type IV secretion system pilin
MRLIPARPQRRLARRGAAPPGRARHAAARLSAALLAAGPLPPAGPVRALAAAASIAQVIGNATAWIAGILAGAATLFLTLGGLRYLMAGGDPGEVEKAKTALKSAAIGYGLAILAPVIVTVLKSLVGG